MKYTIKATVCFVIASALLLGCSGVRYSYMPKLETTAEGAVLRLIEGESTEVLAIGNGFPGWWGFYPGMTTLEPGVASIECKKSRSVIPFREPGVIFGGEVCTLKAHKAGKTILLFGNAMHQSADSYSKEFDIIVMAR